MLRIQHVKHNLFQLTLVVIFISLGMNLQAQRKMEHLDRGVVAVKKSYGVYVSWRLLGNELHGTTFNLYRDGALLNSNPLKLSNYSDSSGVESASYQVVTLTDGVASDTSKATTVWATNYLDIPVRAIDGVFDTYELNDASLGDLDGDGEYEVVVKRLAMAPGLESTDYHYLEAYELDGTFLWAINLGPNIHNKVEVNFLVYDFDEDGIAEVVTRTSDGFTDGAGNYVGDRDGDGVTNYRYSMAYNSTYYRTEGPDYVSVFDGRTGEELAWDYYIPLAPLSQWGLPGHSASQLGHRATKCMWTVAYLDGKHPSFVNGRGIYERTKMEAWDWDGTTLSKRWAFDSSPSGVRTPYQSQGNHNLSLGDADMDGKDEVIYGSMVVDDDGKGLYTTNLGHGDAIHVADMNPDSPGLEVWACLEHSSDWGVTLRKGYSGEIMTRYRSNRDCGRCAAGDINPNFDGYEMWGATESPMYSANGEVVGANNVPMNFMIYWDGDLLSEFLDHRWQTDHGIGNITKYNPETKSTYTLLSATGTLSNNWTKGTPCLQADILGDWREEVIWRTADNKNLRLYTTTNPTEERIPTLMHDPGYRLAVAWQNNSYNQPPHPGFYLAADMGEVNPYPISNFKTIWNSGTNWDINSSANWVDENGNAMVYTEGDDVLFDMIGDNSTAVTLTENVMPRTLTFTSPGSYTLSGTGKISGDATLYKSGYGSLLLNNKNEYSGETKVLYGTLTINDSLANSHVLVDKFGTLYANAYLGAGVSVGTDAKMHIGSTNNVAGSTTINEYLELKKSSLTFDLSDDTSGISIANDHITVLGDLTINPTLSLTINLLNDSLGYGQYELVKFTGNLIGSTDDVNIDGIAGTPYYFHSTDTSLILEILKPRDNKLIEWQGGENNNTWDLAITQNFALGAYNVWFLDNDSVLFGNEGSTNNSVIINGSIAPANIEVNTSNNYLFKGEGELTGNTNLVKTGSGVLTIENTNSYTGKTIINNGTLGIDNISNAGVAGALGSATNSTPSIVINSGSLSISANNSATNRNIAVEGSNSSLTIGSGKDFTYNGEISGSGYLTKNGYGTLTLTSSNTHSGGTTIKNGTVYLATETAINSGLGSGVVNLENGTLKLLDNNGSNSSCSWDINVPALKTGELLLDSRCNYNGSLTGAGSLDLVTHGTRAHLLGDWSAFEGQINVSTDAEGGWLILGNKAGYGKSQLDLSNGVFAVYKNSANDTIELGNLSGDAGSELGAGGETSTTTTWVIGGRGTSAIFKGLITNNQYANTGATSRIIKTGAGNLSLTNLNTYTGGTVIEEGSITIAKTAGSSTGGGDVTVLEGGTLTGDGTIAGSIHVEFNGALSPGNLGIGTMKTLLHLTLNDGAYVLADVNKDNLQADMMHVTGTCTYGGTLYLVLSGTNELTVNDSIHLFEANKYNGEFASIIPAAPASNLEWDLSNLNRNGYIGVKEEGTSIAISQNNSKEPFLIYPNPSQGKISLDLLQLADEGMVTIETLSGQNVYKQFFTNPSELQNMNLSILNPDVYMLTITTQQERYTLKLILE